MEPPFGVLVSLCARRAELEAQEAHDLDELVLRMTRVLRSRRYADGYVADLCSSVIENAPAPPRGLVVSFPDARQRRARP